MSNVIIEKMEKQELLKEYDQCVQALARKAVDKGTINPSLLDRIAKIQSALRECDVLEEIKRQLDYKNEIPIPRKELDSQNLVLKKQFWLVDILQLKVNITYIMRNVICKINNSIY